MKMDFHPYENTLSARGAYEEWGGLPVCKAGG